MGGPADFKPLVSVGNQPPSNTPTRRVKLNVGGTKFESTLGTLQRAGTNSLLFRSVEGTNIENGELFFDRDPEIFRVLLNILRTGEVDTHHENYSAQKLIVEAEYYGITDVLKLALKPMALDGVDLDKCKSIIPNGSDFPSALDAAEDGSLWIGHGSKVTVYDWALRRVRTTVTELSEIKSLHRVSGKYAVLGADDFPGIHVYDPMAGIHVKSLTWVDNEDPRVYNPGVRAICSSDSQIFGSFESGQKMDNTLLVIDKERFEIIKELGRQNGGTGHSKAATKLQWLPSKNLLLVGAAHGGAFGYSGYIRLWDVRSDKIVWDWEEPNYKNPRVVEREVFADMVGNEDLAGIFKISITSGGIAMADMRRLDTPDPWLALIESNPALELGQGGVDNKLLTYNKQLYVSRGGDLEVWSEIPLGDCFKDLTDKEYWETSFRRNFVEHRRHRGQEITHLAVGGNRLFVARKEHQGVEVWQSTAI